MHLRSSAVLIAGVVAATLLTSAVAAPADPRVVLSEGHVDVLDVGLEGGRLTVHVHHETGEHDPADVLLHVKPEAEVPVPADARYAFLGDPGDPVWILPQDHDPNLLFAGLAAEELDPGLVRNDTVHIRLIGLCGPGDVSLFTVDPFGAPDILADSGDGLPDRTPLAAGSHMHLNWAFQAEGDYTLTFVATARLAADNRPVSSGPVHIGFHVGALS
jgi:surface-anchored protein